MCLLVANLCLLLYQQWRQKHAPASMRNQSLAAPAVSSQYGLVSNELSAEGLLRHSLNSCGLAPVLRAATLLQTPVFRRTFALAICFWQLHTGRSFDHSPTPWPDDKWLRILRKARDIIVAGHSKIHTRLLPLHNYLLLFLQLIPKDFDVALLPATLILLHYFFCGSRSTLLIHEEPELSGADGPVSIWSCKL